MISSNLACLHRFLNRSELTVAKELMKIRSTELQAVMSSAGRPLSEGLVEEIKFQCKSKILRKLSTNQKILLYELVAILSLEEPKSWFSLVFLDLQEFYAKIGIQQNLRYFYLSNLTENQLMYEIDCRLWNNKDRTNYFRNLRNPVLDSNNEKVIFSDMFQVLYEIIKTFTCHIIFKNKPKKKVFRKGYNDHGSLGSEFSTTLKQQAQDWSIKEQIEKREKERNDLLHFLLGLNSWI